MGEKAKKSTRRRALATSVVVTVSVLPIVSGAPGFATVTTTSRADFNGDGFSDLAVGVPNEDVPQNVLQPRFQTAKAGAVQVFYGARGGPDVNEVWTQGNAGGGEEIEEGDHFGYSVAAGDFDGDGFADLAVGAPDEDIDLPDQQAGDEGGNGVVHVLYGSADGLTAVGAQVWTQDSSELGDEVEYGDEFGRSLAAGDLNGDGRADLAIGVPAENVGDTFEGGAVNLLYGGPDGLTAALSGDDFWTEAHPGLPTSTAGFADGFGETLAIGHLNADAYADLAIGASKDSIQGSESNGSVTVLYGSEDGVTAVGSQHWHRGSPGIPGDLDHGDHFGAALAVGDFGNGRRGDLAIGAPGVGYGIGHVHVLYGSAEGLTASGAQVLRQGRNGLANDPDGQFGYSLAAANFGRSGKSDLAVGVPFEDILGAEDAGLVHVIYGSRSGLTPSGDQIWHQDSGKIAETIGAEDKFGLALAAGHFGRSTTADLAVGAPCDRVARKAAAGTVNLLYGAERGLRAVGNEVLHQDGTGVADLAEGADNFGISLTGTRPTHINGGAITDTLSC